VTRLSSGTATQADAEALRIWRQRSAAHEAAFRSAVWLWRRTGEAAGASAPAAAGEQRAGRILSRRGVVAGGALAAGIAGLAIAGVRFGYLPAPLTLLADHRTGTGERKRVVLADGSIVELNTRTSLTVAFTDSRRRLDLMEGEADIAMAADARPFVVAASGGTTTTTGARVMLRCLDGTVRVTCLEGTARVTRGRTAHLTAGDQLTYDSTGILAMARIDLAAVTAWQHGMLVFRDRTLGHVVDELNRYRRGWIWIGREAAVHRRISGTFHLDRLDEVLAHVERTLGLQAMRMPGGLVILR
jgi:transmembrane sensor